MALNNKLIVLDIDKRFNRLLLGKSLDTTGARSYSIKLLCNNLAFNLTGLTVQVGGTKPDGFGVLSNCKVIDALKGIIEVDFTTQMLTTAGILKLEIIFLKGDVRLSSIPFEVEVIQSATNYNQMLSSNDFLFFQDELRKIRAQMDAAVDKINNRYASTEKKANELINKMENTVDGSIAKEVYNNTYEKIEGTTVSCQTFSGCTRNLVVEGRTLQNLIKDIETSIANTTVVGNCKTIPYGKKNTLYSIINNTNKKIFINLNNRETNKYLMTITIVGAVLTLNIPYSFYIGGISGDFKDGWNNSNKDDLKNIMLMEGDWTNKEIPPCFEGIKSVGDLNDNKINILSNGRNLFDGELENGYINVNTGELVLDNEWKRSKNYIGVSKGKYRIKASYSNSPSIAVIGYNSKKKFIKSLNGFGLNRIIDIDDDIKYIKFYSGKDIKNIIVSIGDSDNTYQPYVSDKKEILLPISDGLKGLSNDVCDKIYEKDREVILEQNIGRTVLSINEDWKTGSTDGDGKTMRFYFWGGNFTSSWNNPKKILCNNFISNGNNYSYDVECIAIDGQKYLGIRILKSKLQTPTVEGFKKWLKDNPTIVYYNLQEPTYYKIKNCRNLNLKLYNEKTYISSINKIKPITEFIYPNTLKSSVDNNSEAIFNINETINNIAPADIGALSLEDLGKWDFSNRDLIVNNKRALVGYDDADGNKLVVNYEKDFKNGVYITGPINIDGYTIKDGGTGDKTSSIAVVKADGVLEIGKIIDFHVGGDADYHTRLECTGANNLNTSGHFNARGYITSIGNDNAAILGSGPKDVFVCNNESQKYLQLKNDGNLCYSDRKVQLEAQETPLWKGYHHMTEDETITPIKKLSECTNGWILVWSDFNVDGAGENYNFCLTYIPKNIPWKNGQGYNFCTPTDTGEDSYTAKYIYVFNDHIKGDKGNRTGKRNDVVIRAVLEY